MKQLKREKELFNLHTLMRNYVKLIERALKEADSQNLLIKKRKDNLMRLLFTTSLNKPSLLEKWTLTVEHL